MEGFESLVGVNFWTALFGFCNMLITFALLKKFLFKPVKKMIDDRQKEIDGLYANAAQEKAKAEALRAQYDAKLKDAAAVIADPLYRRILPGDRKVRFLDFPHEGYSGRIYRKDIPVFIGEGWNRWVEAYAGRVGI